MKQYIDKAALVAEIEIRIKGLNACHADRVAGYAGEISGLERLLSFLDTLEVKEEHVSEDFDEAAMQYAKSKHEDAYLQQIVSLDFKAGAKWQKEHLIEKAQDWIADTFKYDGSEDFNGGADDAMSMLLDEFTRYMEE